MELHGRMYKACPSGNAARPMSPMNRPHMLVASSTWPAISVPSARSMVHFELSTGTRASSLSQHHADLCARADEASHLKPAPSQRSTLVHLDQAETARPSQPCLGGDNVKAVAVVLDHDDDAVVVEGQQDVDAFRVPVPHGVVDGLLDDAKHRDLHERRQTALLADDAHVRRRTRGRLPQHPAQAVCQGALLIDRAKALHERIEFASSL